MLPKFSVRKPMTVFVAVVLVLVLGFVSFGRMTTDLLPEINLPYVIVMTTYPGASPEEVEDEITRPMEQSMATLDNISSVSSTSADNYCLVMLEFTEGTDMDLVTGEIREKINQINGGWSDLVGTPIILKLDPSMLPVAVVAVDRDDLDIMALSDFVNTTLMNEVEGIEGIASVSASGVVEQTLEIRLDQELIDASNQRIRDAIDAQFAEGEEQIADGLAQVQDGIDQAESAQSVLPATKQQLLDAQVQLKAGIAQAEAELDQKQADLLEAQLQVNAGMLTLTTELENARGILEGLQPLYDMGKELEATLAEAQSYVDLYESYTMLRASFDTLIQKTIDDNPTITTAEEAEAFLAAENNEEYLQLTGQMASVKLSLDAAGGYDAALYETAKTTVLTTQGLLDGFDAQLQMNMGMTRGELYASVDALKQGIAEMEAQLAVLQETNAQLEAGKLSIEEAYDMLDEMEITQSMKITEGLIRVVSAESSMPQMLAQLESTKAELESAQTQLEDAKKAAYDQADLNVILTQTNVAAILGAQNFSMPAGYVNDENGTAYLVRVGDKLDQEQLEDLLLVDLGLDDVEPLYLRDVAHVELVDNSHEVYANINGNPGIMLTFSKQSNYATTVSSANVEEKLAQLEAKYPGLHFTMLMDQGDYINLVVDSVLENLLLGAAFAILVLFLFLRDLRPTFVTACSIPVSLLFAITLMYFSGVTLNVLSLAGLAIAVGMLVDNSIVVIENIYRLRALGVPAKEAAIKGASQVAMAVTASTLTTVCVFAPIVFVQGLTRQLFTDLALTLAYSLGASLVISLTVVPAVSAGILKKGIKEKRRKKEEKRREHRGYTKFLRALLNAKPVVLLIAVALLVFSIFAGLSNGFAYMPQMAATEIMVNVEMTDEDAELADTAALCDSVAEEIRKIDGVDTVGAMLSSGVSGVIGLSTGEASTTSATMYVIVDEDARIYDLEDQIEALFEGLPCEVSVTGTSTMTDMSALGGSGVTIRLFGGNDLSDLQDSAVIVADVLRGVEGIGEVSDGIGETTPELRISVDKEEAMKHGLTVAQVYQQIAMAMTTSATATSINVDDTAVDVVIFSADAQSLSLDDIKNYEFTVTDMFGEEKVIALNDIADIMETQTMTSISRSEQRRYLSVSGSIAEGYNVTNVTMDAQRALEDVDLPGGVTMHFAGENETIMESMVDLVKMLALGIVIIYLIMVAQFQSLKSPFIVMFTIPLAFTGGLFALALCRMEMSIIAMVGFIMLVGIIVNNGIVLIDYANQLREEGKTVRAAVIEAGATRLRPVLMTTITTILGLIPLALGLGLGADLMQPVAIVCIGGLTYATLMTLFVIPVMYEIVFRRQEKKLLAKENAEQ